MPKEESALSRLRSRIVLGAIVSVLLVVAYWWTSAKPDPDVVARRLAGHLRASRWGDIYDMMSAKEKAMQPWGKDQFVAVMRELQSSRIGTLGPIEVKGDWQNQTARKYFHFYFDRTIGGRVQKRAWIAFPVLRDVDDWKPCIANLPLLMNNLDKSGNKEHLGPLLRACRRAKVTAIVRLEDRLEFSMDRLALYLEDKLPRSALYERFAHK